MSHPDPHIEAVGSVPDSAIGALARMLLDVADKERADQDSKLETEERPADNERAAAALATPRRL